TAEMMRRIAERQDAGKWAVLTFTLMAVAASLVAIGAEMPLIKNLQGIAQALRATLMIYTIVISWVFVQTVFALHYAPDYYSDVVDGKVVAAEHPTGLAFPGTAAPTYADFLYFSLTIGMTFQVSDVQVTEAAFRRLILLHGFVSFFFSTGILALTINLVA